MGKKVKTGKSRKDKYYQLAKETGYRARSAFKLLQLNRKYGFLESSRVLVDLCAAPGGWLQVASQHMPVSSHIIGIDLVPIKPIRSVITLTEDITTEKCRQALKKEIQTWKVDVFLNDGAPNVGKNWLHDAFSQATLTLQALKLAIEFLRKGGWFVTKVFRSKDYQALIWVFKQLFRKVFATKPQASRNESAEIFVVCQGFLAPDKVDPKFTDPKYVFKDVKDDPKMELNLIHPEKVKKRTEGYVEGDYTLFHTLEATTYITSPNHLELLANASEIVIDSENIKKHKLTTPEIVECCKDIKVLGKKEIRSLLTWRKKMRDYLKELEEKLEKVKAQKGVEAQQRAEAEVDEEEEEDSDLEGEVGEIDKKIAEMKESELKELKRKKKKVRRKKMKLQQQMNLKMILPGDQMDVGEDMEMFALNKIKNKKALSEVEKGDLSFMDNKSDSESDVEGLEKPRMAYDKFEEHDYGFSSDDNKGSDAEGSDVEMDDLGGAEDNEDFESSEEEEAEDDCNPLVVDLEDAHEKIDRKTSMWFQKDAFKGLDDDVDEDLEIETIVKEYKRRGGAIIEKENTNEAKVASKKRSSKDKEVTLADSDDESESDDEGIEATASDGDDDIVNDSERAKATMDKFNDDSDSSSASDDSDFDMNDMVTDDRAVKRNAKQDTKDGFEIVPANEPVKRVKLDPESLAIGAAMASSRKRRRDIIDQSFNRFTFNDDNLPDWFTKDEQKFCRKQMPVTKEEVAEYKERLKAINARAPKKVAEAKARKKRKMERRLEKARKKAEDVTETVDVSDKEKWQQIKQIYKRAGLLKKKKESVTYVVAKRASGKKVSRPAGVKGKFKVVDPRLKKDMRNQRMGDKKKGGKGKKRGKR